MPIYDQIGQDYNLTRRADPYIAQRLYEFLMPVAGGNYLDIGCGTGNYLNALAAKGLTICGADPSAEMLAQAIRNNPSATFVTAGAEQLPYDTEHFDGIMAVLTIHHWQDMMAGLREINRVLKKSGRLVLFTFTPEQMRGYWLYHYFPIMIERCMLTTPPLAEMESRLRDCGFSHVASEPYFVRENLQDHFLYSFKHRPEKYLIQEVRKGSSGFRLLSDPAELAVGLVRLKQDIETGEIKKILTQYENDQGDYLFMIAHRD
jgi:ubiquinone/menaquinone biosynthesis C-methylase UbiE